MHIQANEHGNHKSTYTCVYKGPINGFKALSPYPELVPSPLRMARSRRFGFTREKNFLMISTTQDKNISLPKD